MYVGIRSIAGTLLLTIIFLPGGDLQIALSGGGGGDQQTALGVGGGHYAKYLEILEQ